MSEASAITRFDIDGELSGFLPMTGEINKHFLLSIPNDWEDNHLQKVLKSSLDVCPPVINKPKKFIFEIKVLNIFYIFSHNLKNLAHFIDSKNSNFKIIASINLRGLDYLWS